MAPKTAAKSTKAPKAKSTKSKKASAASLETTPSTNAIEETQLATDQAPRSYDDLTPEEQDTVDQQMREENEAAGQMSRAEIDAERYQDATDSIHNDGFIDRDERLGLGTTNDAITNIESTEWVVLGGGASEVRVQTGQDLDGKFHHRLESFIPGASYPDAEWSKQQLDTREEAISQGNLTIDEIVSQSERTNPDLYHAHTEDREYIGEIVEVNADTVLQQEKGMMILHDKEDVGAGLKVGNHAAILYTEAGTKPQIIQASDRASLTTRLEQAGHEDLANEYKERTQAIQDNERLEATGEHNEQPTMPTPPQQDITAKQVERQLDAMGNDNFRVALRSETGITQTNELTKDELLQKIPYLKMMNVKGNDILIKPIGENNLVMVDGLKKEAMDALHVKDGGPAAALQVAPDKYQVWVKVGDKPIPAQERREIAKMLTEEHGGDIAAVTEGHYGRLAGFTNRSPELTKEDGKQPWVKIETAKGEAIDDEKAAELLTSANATVQEVNQRLEYLRNRAVESFRDVEPAPGQLNPKSADRDPVVAFKSTAARLFERYGEGFDDAKADWMIAKDMALKGWDKQEISKAIQESSSNIEPRKFDAMKEYANRLAGRAASAADLSKDKSKSLDKGMER